MDAAKVWYVSGADEGIGPLLIGLLLDAGYRVAATAEHVQSLRAAVPLIDSDRFLPLAVDPRNPDCLQDTVLQTLSAFGRIDVALNNTGRAVAGTLEETEDAEIRRMFDSDVFAAIYILKNILPVLRQQQSGSIFIVGATADKLGKPGWALYSATQSALASIAGVLALEQKAYGIKVALVNPVDGDNPVTTCAALIRMAETGASY